MVGYCGVFGITHGLVRKSGSVEARPIAKLRGTRAAPSGGVAGTGVLAGVARAALGGGVAGTCVLACVAGRPTGAR